MTCLYMMNQLLFWSTRYIGVMVVQLGFLHLWWKIDIRHVYVRFLHSSSMQNALLTHAVLLKDFWFVQNGNSKTTCYDFLNHVIIFVIVMWYDNLAITNHPTFHEYFVNLYRRRIFYEAIEFSIIHNKI